MLTLALQTRAVPAANEQPKDSTNTLPLKTQATESEHARAGGESEGESESAGAHARVCGVAGQGHQRKCPLCSASCVHSIRTFQEATCLRFLTHAQCAAGAGAAGAGAASRRWARWW